VGNTETGQRVVDTVLGALAQAIPDMIPAASQGTMNNFTVGGFIEGTQFVYYETIAGGHGASVNGNGLSGKQSHMTNTLNTPVEALEYSLPMRVLRYELRDNSGGHGIHNGGDGITREYEFLVPTTITINSERRLRAPYGVKGGEEGKKGVNTIVKGGKSETVSGKYTTHLNVGDHVIIETPGGGGWGKPQSKSS
jgi:N-methylhydantoinase B